MRRFYSQSTGCTYLSSIHPTMPADAVEIDGERYEAVIANPALGKVRSHDADGLPILIDPPPATDDELAAAERAWRDAEIESVRWLRERHRDEVDSARPTTLTVEQSGELLDYVQALRDWPAVQEFPDQEYRPIRPAWIPEQHQ
ncbi:phage tail assembly chaperone [Pseudomonas sp. B21-056]|uniref:phage tail assembly chaperone n=1 Tax=Pseudomonas sp. B21-056 TaxID=2895495 RepID=UPI00223015E1|nr:phage tail assembly chaperone [Pseudomonas sp. B21-056]UZE21866.1 phage tail assembly chaperone [Pseudomonas sp. B21-056]